MKEDDSFSLFDLKKRLYDWYQLFSSLNFCSEINPYCNIFGMHLFEQFHYLKSKGIHINRFSMQGLEKQNDFLSQYYHRSTNKKKSYITDIKKKKPDRNTYIP